MKTNWLCFFVFFGGGSTRLDDVRTDDLRDAVEVEEIHLGHPEVLRRQPGAGRRPLNSLVYL